MEVPGETSVEDWMVWAGKTATEFPSGGNISFVEGQQRVLTVRGLQAAVTDQRIVSLELIPACHQVVMTAHSCGRLRLRVWRAGKPPRDYLLTVTGHIGHPQVPCREKKVWP